jgi:hypothetical protein
MGLVLNQKSKGAFSALIKVAEHTSSRAELHLEHFWSTTGVIEITVSCTSRSSWGENWDAIEYPDTEYSLWIIVHLSSKCPCTVLYTNTPIGPGHPQTNAANTPAQAPKITLSTRNPNAPALWAEAVPLTVDDGAPAVVSVGVLCQRIRINSGERER